MPTLLIDASPSLLPEAAHTWGDLLARLDAELTPRGLLVTDVRFDGLDEPAFRDACLLGRPLAELAVVEVLTGTPQSLMTRCLLEAADSIAPLCAGIVDLAGMFRQGRVTEANDGLVQVADSICTLVTLAGHATQMLDPGSQPPVKSLPEMARNLATHLEALTEAQASCDWPRVADVLEREVAPALQQWAPAFGRLCQAPAA